VYSGKSSSFSSLTDKNKGYEGDITYAVLCGLYLFFGLSLLAMCMDLMKEEVIKSNYFMVHSMNFYSAYNFGLFRKGVRQSYVGNTTLIIGSHEWECR